MCPNRGGGGNLANRKRAFGSFLGMMQDSLEKTAYYDLIEDAEEFEDDEVIAFNLEATRGKGILDGGATRSAGGIDQLEPLQQEYIADGGVGLEIEPSAVEFTFADGERSQAGSRVLIPVAKLGGEPIGVHCMETPTPILLGLNFHRQLGCAVEYHYNTVWSCKHGRFLEVEQLPSRHLAIDLRPGGSTDQ